MDGEAQGSTAAFASVVAPFLVTSTIIRGVKHHHLFLWSAVFSSDHHQLVFQAVKKMRRSSRVACVTGLCGRGASWRTTPNCRCAHRCNLNHLARAAADTFSY